MTEELYIPTELEEKVIRDVNTTELSDLVDPDIFAGAETESPENNQILYSGGWRARSIKWHKNPKNLALMSLLWYCASAFCISSAIKDNTFTSTLASIAATIQLFNGTLYGLLSIKYYIKSQYKI